MKLLLLARGGLGLNVLKFLLSEYPGDVGAVATVDEDKIFRFAEQHAIPAFICGRNTDLAGKLRKTGIEAELGAMVWWPWRIAQALISFPKRGFVNTHPAFLPHCRGSMSNFWALVEGAPYGVSIHKVDERLDHGQILAQTEIEVGWEDTDETLYHRALAELEKLFIKIWPALREDNLRGREQNFSAGSYHKLSETNNATRLDLDAPNSARNILNLLRARSYAGAAGCWFEENGRRYEVRVKIREV